MNINLTSQYDSTKHHMLESMTDCVEFQQSRTSIDAKWIEIQ